MNNWAPGNEPALPSPVLRLSDLVVRYQQHVAVKALSLAVDPGQTVALVGRSGCGKSSVLKAIVGIVKADAGRIELVGETLSDANLNRLRRCIGYVIQGGGLFPHLTARQNVALPLDASPEDPIEALAERLHFPPDLLDRYPNQLSGGERQRVALMRALVNDPPLLLLDEPLGALDPMIRSALQDELKDLIGELGKAVVLVSHDLAEAEYLGDEVILLKAGEVAARGRVADWLNAPKSSFEYRFVDAQRRAL